MRYPIKLTFLACISVILVAVAYFVKQLEVTSISFNTYQDVISKPERLCSGWLPSWLPKSAYQIKESHDIDTNQSWLTFNFMEPDSFYNKSVCKPIKRDEASLPYDRNIKRFPDFALIINDQLRNNTALRFYLCEGIGPRNLAIDMQLYRAYVWGP